MSLKLIFPDVWVGAPVVVRNAYSNPKDRSFQIFHHEWAVHFSDSQPATVPKYTQIRFIASRLKMRWYESKTIATGEMAGLYYKYPL